MAVKKIQTTKDYRMFERHSGENRPLDIKKHKKLMDSMKLYGFLPCFPIVVVRNSKGHLIVKDGQHRLLIAETLKLPVHWIEETIDFDVAIVNSTARVWQLRDYAQKHAANGLKAYSEGLTFAEAHSLPLGISFALLAGTTNFANCEQAFTDGSWKVKDRSWADAVAGIYGPLVVMASQMRNARLIEACMAVCRVPGFDASRLLNGAERCREKLVAYSTRDAYLDMMEELYNYGRKQLVGLKSAAVMAMRERSAIGKKKAEKKAEKKEKAA
jgi:hypothetical protein